MSSNYFLEATHSIMIERELFFSESYIPKVDHFVRLVSMYTTESYGHVQEAGASFWRGSCLLRPSLTLAPLLEASAKIVRDQDAKAFLPNSVLHA